jgi:hypothetical protein
MSCKILRNFILRINISTNSLSHYRTVTSKIVLSLSGIIIDTWHLREYPFANTTIFLSGPFLLKSRTAKGYVFLLQYT